MFIGKIGNLGSIVLMLGFLFLLLMQGLILILIPIFFFILWFIITILRKGIGVLR